MKTAVEQLSKYALYHRDIRNIWTHFVGVPLIVCAVAILLSRPTFTVAGYPLSMAWIAVTLTSLYYILLDVRLGLASQVILMPSLFFGQLLAAQSTQTWLAWGIGLFVVGWIIQFIGHYFEGKKPAFVDDIMGLLIGPYFVTAEALFLCGMCTDLAAEITRRSGEVKRN